MNKRDILRQFSKEELIEIAKELELEPQPFSRSPKIIDAVIEDLEDNGIPDVDDCSDVMWEFMLVGGFIDEDGNIIDEGHDDGMEDSGNDVELTVINRLPDVMPECFSLADIKDPSCRKCRVFDPCHEKREASRPPCYGKYFSETADECSICIEAGPCRQVCVA